MASSCWGLGWRRGALVESQQRAAKAVGELGGDTWSGAGAGVASGGAARRLAAALSRGRGGGQRKKKGGVRDCCGISKTLGTSL
jgi:hypothetical protein